MQMKFKTYGWLKEKKKEGKMKENKGKTFIQLKAKQAKEMKRRWRRRRKTIKIA